MPRIVVDTDVRVPLRDGVELAADVYRLDSREPLPVLVHRTPYDRRIANFSNIPADVLALVRDGLAVVVQDTRGRGESAGTFTPFADEAADGADTVSWAAARPWSNGRVRMFGASYVGAARWLAAAAALARADGRRRDVPARRLARRERRPATRPRSSAVPTSSATRASPCGARSR